MTTIPQSCFQSLNAIAVGRVPLGARWCHIVFLAVGAMLIPSAAIAQPALTLTDGLTLISSGDTHDLGTIAAGEPAGFAFTVRNLGDELLLFDAQSKVVANAASAVGEDGAFVTVTDLSVDLGADSIAPGDFGVLTIAFTPLSIGQAVVTVQIQSNDPNSPLYSFDLSAMVTAPLLVVSDGLNLIAPGDVINLGPADVGDTMGKPLTLRNSGDGDLVFDSVDPVVLGDVTGGIVDFQGDVVGSPIAPDGLGVVTTGFTISQPGNVRVEIILNSNDLQNPAFRFFLDVEVAGGEDGFLPVPAIQLSRQESVIADGDTVDLGDVTVGALVQELFDITNAGDGTLTLGEPEVELVVQDDGPAGDFTADVGLAEVPPGESATLVVTFAPSAVGLRLLQVRLHSDDPATPTYTFQIEANGIESAPPGNSNTDDPTNPNNGNTNNNGTVNQPPVDNNQDRENRSMCGAGVVTLGPLWLLPLFFRKRR